MEAKDLSQDTVFGLKEDAIFSEAIITETATVGYHFERGLGGKVRCVETVSFLQ